MPTVSEILKEHVTLDIESVDRVYLNGYVSHLQMDGQLAKFFVKHRGCPVPSPKLLRDLTTAYVKEVESLIEAEDIPKVQFEPKDKKDVIGNRMRAKHAKRDAVVFVRVAQEKATTFKDSESKAS